VQAPVGSKLDPFSDSLCERLQADPSIQSQRLRELATKVGYLGGKPIFDEYGRQRRIDRLIHHAKSSPSKAIATKGKDLEPARPPGRDHLSDDALVAKQHRGRPEQFRCLNRQSSSRTLAGESCSRCG
jgi:hypothetical protein